MLMDLFVDQDIACPRPRPSECEWVYRSDVGDRLLEHQAFFARDATLKSPMQLALELGHRAGLGDPALLRSAEALRSVRDDGPRLFAMFVVFAARIRASASIEHARIASAFLSRLGDLASGLSSAALPRPAPVEEGAGEGLATAAAEIVACVADVATEFRVLVLHFSPDGAPDLVGRLDRQTRRRRIADRALSIAGQEAAVARPRAAAWTAEKRAAAAARRRTALELVDRERLRYLVWSHPTVSVGRMFGVTEAAVRKRCQALGVQKPPRGFWAKVLAGLEPHPGGRPPAT